MMSQKTKCPSPQVQGGGGENKSKGIGAFVAGGTRAVSPDAVQKDVSPRSTTTSVYLLSTVWFALCTSLVMRQSELMSVFLAFVSSFAAALLLERMNRTARSPSSIWSLRGDVVGVSYATASFVKCGVGIMAILASLSCLVIPCKYYNKYVVFLPWATGGMKAGLHTSFDGTAVFEAISIVAGYLAFDLWYTHCRRVRPRPSIRNIVEDAITLTVLVSVLTKMEKKDLDRYRSSFFWFLGYKLLRLVGDMFVNGHAIHSVASSGEGQGSHYDVGGGSIDDACGSPLPPSTAPEDTAMCMNHRDVPKSVPSVEPCTSSDQYYAHSDTCSDDSSRDSNGSADSSSPQDRSADALTTHCGRIKIAEAAAAPNTSNLWTIHGCAYDLSDFVNRHPGGREAIELGRGRDCTAMFESYHPFTNAHKMVLRKYQPVIPPTVGEITEAQEHEHRNWIVDKEEGRHPIDRLTLDPFYEELKRRAMEVLASNGIDPVRDRCSSSLRVGYYIGIAALVVHAGWSHLQGSPLGSILFGIFGWLVGALGHDGGHFSVSRIPFVNEVSVTWGMSLLCNPVMWQQQHTYAHHSHTNDFDHDPDLHHFDMFLRVHRRIRRLPKYALQRNPLFVVFAYAFVVFGTCLWIPLQFIREGTLYGIVEWTDRHRPLRALTAMLHLALYTGIVVLGPFVFSQASLFVAVLCVMLHVATTGLCFAFFSQINHMNERSIEVERTFPTKQENARIKLNPQEEKQAYLMGKSWAARQVETSNNFAADSLLWHILSNGLNLQIEHHLFPGLNHCHLHLLTQVVRNTCEEFGVQYKSYESWSGIAEATLQWLDVLGQG